MIYLTAPGGRLRVVVLDDPEHARLKAARAPLLTPDKSIMVAWTPDPAWLLEAIRTGAGTSQAIARSIDLAARRPPTSSLLGPDGQPMTAPPPEPKPAAPDYTAAVDELMGIWPLEGYELEAFMSATFIPAVEAARQAARGV